MNREHLSEQERKEAAIKALVKHNVRLMENDMHDLLTEESWGGNAETIDTPAGTFLAAGANGIVDPRTGKILAFGNPQDIDPAIRRKGDVFAVEVYSNIEAKPEKYFIRANRWIPDNAEIYTKEAQEVLNRTIEDWNNLQAKPKK